MGCGAPSSEEAAGLNQTRQLLLTGPDFIVREVSAPPSAFPNGPLPVTVTVCNQGTDAESTSVDVLLSEDPVLTAEDLPLYSQFLSWLQPGQCATNTFYTSASSPNGARYVGAVADLFNGMAESDETNNARTGPLVGIGYDPDIIIQEVSTPASVFPGQLFTASVTVCNQGTVGGSSEVQLVLSQDTDIRFSWDGPPAEQDMPVFSFYSGPLDAGQCRKQQVQFQLQPPFEGAWYLGAVADPGNMTPELIKTNNTRASELFGIGAQADYTIQTVSGPPSIAPGMLFTASVRVCNRGTMGGSTQVQLVLSQDATIQFSPELPPQEQDQPLIAFPTGPLEAGQCRTQQVQTSVQVPQEGPWYLGAVADPGNGAPELIETNNTRASQAVGVGYQPDFIIESVSGPPSATPGWPVAVSVTVCNQGTQGGSTDVQLVLSEDTDIRFSYNEPPMGQDQPLYSFPTGWLGAGQCRTQQVEANAQPYHYGAYYLGAVADPGSYTLELIETNNTRASKVIGVGYDPDFIVQSVSGPASILPGQPFTVSVTVCNQGTLGGGTDVQLVLSEDTTIRFDSNSPPSGQDPPLYNYYTGPLQPGQCKTEQVQTSAWVQSEGAWYLGAIADPGSYSPELVETNNTRASALTGIGNAPDIIIQSVSTPASALSGQSFTASVTVCNQGTAPGPVEVQLVLSEDTDIRFDYNPPPNGEDFPAGFFYLSGGLQPGECRTEQAEAHGWVPQEGAWHLGAVADPGNSTPELIEINNTGASGPIGIGYGADYVIQAVTVPASLAPGQQLMASVTVCNQGTTGGSTDVQLVLSEDSTIRFSYNGPPESQDPPIYNFYTGPLEPGQCRTEQVQTSLWPPHEGAWYLGVVADPGSYEPELIETNNTRASKAFGIGYRPDYIITEVSGPASITPGQPFTASVTVCNQGTQGGSAEVHLVLSEDTDIRFSYNGPMEGQDQPLYNFYLGFLEPGQCRTQQVETSAWVQYDKAWYLGAVADPGNSEQEFFENNNTRASAPMGIGYRSDYIITEVSGPVSVTPGQPFTASVTVCNQGTVSGYADVQLVLSSDTDIRFNYNSPPYSQDLPLYNIYPGSLEPGQCKAQQVQISASAPDGVWYLGAVADPGNYEQEFLETNNTRASAPMGLGYRSDLVIDAVSGPASVMPGQSFTASVTVCNRGTQSAPVDVQLVLSEDTDIRFSYNGPPSQQDFPIGSLYIPGALEPGQCVTQEQELQAWAPHEGAWHLGAVADPGNYEQEFLETNNTLASKAFGIGYKADYIITAVSGPASITPGQTFTASVTVCNQGTQGGGTEVQLVLSEDSTIQFSYSAPPYNQDQPLQSFFMGPLEAGQCTTQQVQANAYPPQHGAWYLGAVADPGGSEQEFLETNNTRASAAMGIGYSADLVIRALTAPASVTFGQPYPVTVEVCNQGTEASFAEVQLVLSQDTDIRFSYNDPPAGQDLPVEYLSFSNLLPGQCTQQTLSLSMPPPQPGIWYVGAVADPGLALPEFFENNNTRASSGIFFLP